MRDKLELFVEPRAADYDRRNGQFIDYLKDPYHSQDISEVAQWAWQTLQSKFSLPVPAGGANVFGWDRKEHHLVCDVFTDRVELFYLNRLTGDVAGEDYSFEGFAAL